MFREGERFWYSFIQLERVGDREIEIQGDRYIQREGKIQIKIYIKIKRERERYLDLWLDREIYREKEREREK